MAEEKKTTTAKAPAKTVRRVRKTAQKAEQAQEQPTIQKEERRMSQEALGMVETRGLVASIVMVAEVHYGKPVQRGC